MKVLVYYPASYISVFILTAIDDLIKHEHTVYLFTIVARGELHEAAEKLGAIVYVEESPNRVTNVFQASWQLIRFCRRHKIEIVFSHLQYLNLVTVCSRFFIKASVFPLRHHADDVYLGRNRNGRILDKLVNLFSSKILVVSEASRVHMMTYENVPSKKVIVLPLYYNFDFYHFGYKQEEYYQQADSIGENLQLISIGRMVKNKNHLTLLKVVAKLVVEGMNINLILLDSGPLEYELKHFVKQAGMENNIIFIGRKTDIMYYLKIADLLVHPSISEASCQVTKEAGICRVPIITVEGVGDFDEYVIDGENGFTVSKDNIENELYEILKSVYKDKSTLKLMGGKLEKSVREKFDVSSATKTFASIIDPFQL